MTFVWLFHGDGAQFASGAFSSCEAAERWIETNCLTGLLTRYPMDQGSYDWAVTNGTFVPKRDNQKTPKFIQRFADGSVHHHYEHGKRIS
jgi:hypothetical protein